MWPNPQETADLVIFNEEILNVKLHFLCSESCTKHENNIRQLAIEMFKVKHELLSEVFERIFVIMILHNCAQNLNLVYQKSILPCEIKSTATLSDFNKSIKKWKPDYPCKICKTYLRCWICRPLTVLKVKEVMITVERRFNCTCISFGFILACSSICYMIYESDWV